MINANVKATTVDLVELVEILDESSVYVGAWKPHSPNFHYKITRQAQKYFAAGTDTRDILDIANSPENPSETKYYEALGYGRFVRGLCSRYFMLSVGKTEPWKDYPEGVDLYILSNSQQCLLFIKP